MPIWELQVINSSLLYSNSGQNNTWLAKLPFIKDKLWKLLIGHKRIFHRSVSQYCFTVQLEMIRALSIAIHSSCSRITPERGLRDVMNTNKGKGENIPY